MMVWAAEWMMYSSTDGRIIGTLWRIRNSQSSAINWRTTHYYTSYSGLFIARPAIYQDR